MRPFVASAVTALSGRAVQALTANARRIEGARGLLGALNWAGAKLLHAAHLARANTIAGSARNISEHYDAGNAMYALLLDRTLTYSAGIHRQGDTLEAAQLRKLDALLDGARVGAGSHVLEIGCGWGSCAIRAAQRTGCRWTGAPLGVHRDGLQCPCSRASRSEAQSTCRRRNGERGAAGGGARPRQGGGRGGAGGASLLRLPRRACALRRRRVRRRRQLRDD